MDDDRRVELVGRAPENGSRTQRIGLALLLSVAIGFGPLQDAATGAGSFPGAVGRYLLCLACALAGVLTLGRLLDTAPRPDGEAAEATADGAPRPIPAADSPTTAANEPV